MKKLKLEYLSQINTKYLAGLPSFKNEKNKKYLAITLTLAASMFFALFAINPTLSTISKLHKEIEDNTLVQQKLEKKISALSSLSQEYPQVKEDETFIVNAVPKDPQVTDLAAQIQSVADQSNVSVADLKVSTIDFSVATKSGVINFSVSANGSTESVTSFISNLIGMQRIVSVDSLSFTQVEEGSDISIKASAYYKK